MAKSTLSINWFLFYWVSAYTCDLCLDSLLFVVGNSINFRKCSLHLFGGKHKSNIWHKVHEQVITLPKNGVLGLMDITMQAKAFVNVF